MKRFFVIFLLTVLMISMACVMAEAVEVTPEPVVIVEEQPFFNLTGIVVALLGVCGVILTLYIRPWIKANTTEKQQTILSLITTTLVFAAEQLYKGEGRGSEKMEYVKGELEKRGFTIDISAIEAAVYDLTLQQAAVMVYDEAPKEPDEPVSLPMSSGLHGSTQDAFE